MRRGTDAARDCDGRHRGGVGGMRWNRPSLVSEWLAAMGMPTAIERLGGMSGGRCWRVRFAETSVIVKNPASSREYYFYNELAPHLVAQGIAIPALYQSALIENEPWLLIEDIPYSLPREQFPNDVRVLETLHRLHHSSIQPHQISFDLYHPAWDDALTDNALSLFPSERAVALRPRLCDLQAESQALFVPRTPISADPNPANWGLREDGTAVLFDWERFTFAAPAIDLGISVPGLGKAETFRRVARAYLELDELEDEQAVAALARGALLAKAWTVVELLAEFAGREERDEGLVERLVREFPGWINAQMVRTRN